MSFDCKILLDSISETGKRLTTFEITFPRIVLAEFNTHRMFSRNSASSRAIPFTKQLERVMSDPFIPARFPINGKGMQPQGYYEKGSKEYKVAVHTWLQARNKAALYAREMTGKVPAAYESSGSDFRSDTEIFINVHKQISNRLLEPFMWHTVICTATEFSNFFKLRTHTDAQIEIRTIADMMYNEYHNGIKAPIITLASRDWHCPLVSEEDENLIRLSYGTGKILSHLSNPISALKEFKKRVSVARCARVSYLTHDGKRDIEQDVEMFDRLVIQDPQHSSPTEHVAEPYHQEITREDYDTYSRILTDTRHPDHLLTKERLQVTAYNEKYWLLPRIGNFFGWKQMRKDFPNENITQFKKEQHERN